jgi:hypothetical protein
MADDMASTTPIGAVAGGLLAGAAGTAAMDTFLFARYRRDGGRALPGSGNPRQV